jgi:hypothetical protein
MNQQNTKNIIDTYILMGNSEKLLKEMANLNLDMILQRINTFKSDDIETNLTVLINQIQTIRLPPVQELPDEEE